MKKIISIFIFTIYFGALNAQTITPKEIGFEHFSLNDKKLGKIDYYLSNDVADKKKPLLVYLDGSGAFPLFQKMDIGIGSSVVIDYKNLSKQYRVLLISKPGVPFVDDVKRDPNGFPLYNEPSDYIEKLSLDWRVESANKIINLLIKNKEVDSKKVIVFGFSEGAQVAPKLATTNTHVTHLMLFGGNGLNQFFDPVINARFKAARGQVSEVKVQKEIDSLFKVYNSIYSEANNTEKKWWGHTYKRWASFTKTDPFIYLLQLDIPIYIANGSLDVNSVLSADYIQLEFIKNQKNNLTYKTYPGFDHQFNELIFEDGRFKEAKPKLTFVLNEAFKWLDSN
jgi:pimeloyl-ACP methyl ester carboxylesterase